MEEIPEELQIPDDILSDLEKPDLLRSYIDEGKSLQEIIGYSTSVMEQLYQAAVIVFEEGRHREAQDGFLFLTTLNPYVYAYWLGLAMSYQLLEEYEEAIIAYECASKIDEEKPQPFYYLAGCYLLLNETQEAQKMLRVAKEKCQNDEESREFLKKIAKTEARLKIKD